MGIQDVLETIIEKIPSPKGDIDAPLQALIIDSWFDNYLGVVSLVRIRNGLLKAGDKIQIMSTKQIHQADTVGVFTPKMKKLTEIRAGEVGFIVAGIKDIHGAPVGDTITSAKNPTKSTIPGFKKIQPQVYAGMFPISTDDYEAFREALDKLSLNDASLFYEPETSQALGFGFRCGFLGMLHMEIIQERLEREYNLDLITSAPTVIYKINLKDGTDTTVDNPSKLPDLSIISDIAEPIVRANILTPQEYVGSIITLCIEKRGTQVDLNYVGRQVNIIYDIPMIEVVSNFFDKLKSVSKGYASLDYALQRYDVADMVRLDILVNGDKVDAFASIVHKSQAQFKGRDLVERLKELIPRQMFEVALQAAVGGTIIARSTVKAMRKNVLAKCYGGDVSRKRKLLEKQKAGKKRMKNIGSVEVPQEAFLAVLRK